MKRVVVTGGAGFVGRTTIGPLQRLGYDIHVADVRPPGVPGCTFHEMDLMNASSPARLMERVRPTHLLHLAWYVKHGEFWTSLENTRWVQASLELLDAFARSGGERCVGSGTCAEYEWGHDICREDETPCRPATLYGACKYAVSVIQPRLCAQSGISSAWGRLFHLYGPGEPERRFVPSLILPLLRGEPASCTHGRQVRDFMHVEDAGAAFAALLDSPAEGAVNIATGAPVMQRRVAEIIAELTGRADLLRVGAIPAAEADPERLTADTSRLAALGFRPQHTVETGLASTVSWWRERLA